MKNRLFKQGQKVTCNGNKEGRVIRYPYNDSETVEVRLMDGCRYVGDVAVCESDLLLENTKAS